MNTSKLLVFICAIATLAGCSAEPVDRPIDVGESVDALATSKVLLPSGDPCRGVLAPLSVGLADGAGGPTTGITVSLTSATDTRLYTVGITGGGAPLVYELELDNDSASKCLLLSASAAPNAALGRDSRSRATKRELRATAPISVSPAGDDCAATVKLLAQAAGVSAVGASLQKVDVALESETEDRDYVAHVHGKSFIVDGRTFPNDYDFSFSLSNDSAFKCFVQGVSLK